MSSRTSEHPGQHPDGGTLGESLVFSRRQEDVGQAGLLLEDRRTEPSPRLGPGQHYTHGHGRREQEARRQQGNHFFLAFLPRSGRSELPRVVFG
jgi:hypothetical protein